MSPLILTLVAAVEAYDIARDTCDRLSAVVIVFADVGRSR